MGTIVITLAAVPFRDYVEWDIIQHDPNREDLYEAMRNMVEEFPDHIVHRISEEEDAHLGTWVMKLVAVPFHNYVEENVILHDFDYEDIEDAIYAMRLEYPGHIVHVLNIEEEEDK